MKKTFLLSFVFLLSLLSISSGDKISNEIKGIITLTNACAKTPSKVDYYTSGTEIMHSKHPLAQVDMNVIISLHPLDFKPKLSVTKNAYISQSEQTFIPNVLPVVVGSKVHFLNEDEFFHNVRSDTRKAKFTIGRRAPGISYSKKIKKIGIVELSCDIHKHMNAKILSFDTPYFSRINKDGTYSIKGLPDGTYRLEAYHPFCEKFTKEIKLSGGKILDFNFKIFERP